jgi:hypothetical protein
VQPRPTKSEPWPSEIQKACLAVNHSQAPDNHQDSHISLQAKFGSFSAYGPQLDKNDEMIEMEEFRRKRGGRRKKSGSPGLCVTWCLDP